MRGETRLQEITQQKESSLVERWVDEVRPVAQMREEVGKMLDSNNAAALEAYGVPKNLHGVMRLWRESAPDILTSFSHPEELDIYKVVALFHLRLFQQQAAKQGIKLPSVLVNYYDTVALHKSALKPLQVGNVGVGVDFLGIARKNKNSTAFINGQEVAVIQQRVRDEVPAISGNLVQLLQEDLILSQREQVTNPEEALPKKVLVERAREILQGRLEQVAVAFVTAVPGGIRHQRDSMKVSRMLMQFEQQLTQQVLGLDESLENAFGYDVALSSENPAFLALIRQTIAMLVEARGMQILKDVIAVGEGLVVSDTPENKQTLSKNANEQFTLRSRTGEEKIITDDEALNFALTHIPLGKLESLALVAGGYTFHMGSEYGIRSKLIDILGLVRKAAVMAQELRIGKDKEHGTDGIILQGTSSYVPLVLACVLLGEQGVKDILAHALTLNSPIEMDAKTLKKLAAQGLMDELRKEQR